MAKNIDKKDVEGITADKIIYKHAIDMCQSAALEELFGNPDEVCFHLFFFFKDCHISCCQPFFDLLTLICFPL